MSTGALIGLQGLQVKEEEKKEAMTKWRHWLKLGALITAVTCLPGISFAASEVDILLEKLVEKGVLSNIDAGIIRKEITETKEARNKEIAKDIVPTSARNWNWKGDIRLRNEFRDGEGDSSTATTNTGRGTDNRVNRQRIRFRFGTEGKVAENLKANFRLATGTAGDPVSTNQSFDVNFTKVSIFLDSANLEWTPAVPGITKTTLIGGIMENPLWTVGPMVFDGDTTFHGLAGKVSQEMGPVTVFTNNGIFVLDTDETEPSALWMAQLGASAKLFPDAALDDEFLVNLKLTGAVAYHDYMNTYRNASGRADTDPLVREAQNTSAAEDFNQLNPTVELSSVVAGVPFSLFSDFVHNYGGENGANNGFQFGVKLGKATTPWSLKNGWEAGYFFQRLEQDAAYDEFADSDFLDGGTNNHGNVFWITLATLKNSTAGIKFFKTENLKGAKDTETRIQMDWVTKF